MVTNGRKIIFTVDVEEFDTALEFGHPLSIEEQVDVSTRGLNLLTERLHDQHVQATLFTTANYATYQPQLMRALAQRHEIASHGFFHLKLAPGDLFLSRQTLETITGQAIVGFRRAQMGYVDIDELREAGFLYNASLHPTWLPGRYNHLTKPRLPFINKGILQIPASVTPTLRIPLFWLSLKNFPFALYKQFCLQTLRSNGHLNLYVHPWEFTDLSAYHRIPTYIRRHSHERLLERVEMLLRFLAPHGEFSTMQAFAHSILNQQLHEN